MALTAEETRIYRAAEAADAAFHRELVRLYGSRAGDMRYQPQRWTSRTLKALSIRSQRATARWLKAFRAANLRTPVGTTSNPIRRRRGPYPRGRTPAHLKRYLFKKGHR